MSWTPSHKIYASNGTSLLYTFEYIIERDPVLTSDEPDFVEHTNLRGNGSIIIPGGNKPYDITLRGVLRSTNYENLISAFSAMQTAIAVNTRYYLKIDKTSTTTEDIKVMRLSPIIVDTSRGRLTTYLYYTIVFRANSWQ